MSNPQSTGQKFSLKSFKTKTQTLNKDSTTAVSAPRKKNHSTLIEELKLIGLDIDTGSEKNMKFKVQKILDIYKHTKLPEMYIQPGSQCSYSDRYAMLWQRPAINQIVPSKQETLARFSTYKAKELALLQKGYAADYVYIPSGTDPSRKVWLFMSKLCSREVFENSFMRMKGHFRTPAQMPNMMQKLITNMAKQIKECPPERIMKAVNESTCHMPDAISFFEDQLANQVQPVEAYFNFIVTANANPTSPSFPWTHMKKPTGDPWGTMGPTNTPLMEAILATIKRLLSVMFATLGVKPEDRSRVTNREAFIKGEELYSRMVKEIYVDFGIDSVLQESVNIRQHSKLHDLAPHLIWLMGAGNVKPVTADDVKEGKPDRSIFQSPAVVRLMYMALSGSVGDNWNHPSELPHFGWQTGGSQELLERLFDQIPPLANFAWQEQILVSPTPKRGFVAHDFSFRNVCFAAPDVKGQDQHFHSSFYEILYRVLNRDFVSRLPPLYSKLVSLSLGFLKAMETTPLILTSGNVLFQGAHLNPSGGPFTARHSQNHSIVLGNVFKELAPQGCFVAHVSKGDDALLALYNPKRPVGSIFDPSQLPKDSTDNVVTYNGSVESFVQAEYSTLNTSSKSAWMISCRDHIKKMFSVDLKPETISRVHLTLSDVEFLGAHIRIIPSGIYCDFNTFVAARPLPKIFFSILWGQTPPGKGVNPDLTTCMRIFAAYYDAVLTYADVVTPLVKLYNLLKPGNEASIVNHTFTESGYLSVPQDFTHLPDLPELSQVFTWMTGESCTADLSQGSVEGVDDLSFEEDVFDALPPANSKEMKQKKNRKESKPLIEEVLPQVDYEEEPEPDVFPEAVSSSTSISTTSTGIETTVATTTMSFPAFMEKLSISSPPDVIDQYHAPLIQEPVMDIAPKLTTVNFSDGTVTFRSNKVYKRNGRPYQPEVVSRDVSTVVGDAQKKYLASRFYSDHLFIIDMLEFQQRMYQEDQDELDDEVEYDGSLFQ